MHAKKVHESVLLYSLPSTRWPEVYTATLHGRAKFSMKAFALINAPTVRHHPGHCYHQKPKKGEGNTLNGKLFHPPSQTRPHGTSGQTLSCLFSRASTRGWMSCSSLVQTMRWWELSVARLCLHFCMILYNRGKCWILFGCAQCADLSSTLHTFGMEHCFPLDFTNTILHLNNSKSKTWQRLKCSLFSSRLRAATSTDYRVMFFSDMFNHHKCV